jgi:rfaE bifunctional protein nucleotidyltransferase chain/domain
LGWFGAPHPRHLSRDFAGGAALSNTKLLTDAEAKQRITASQASGDTVVFTCGCFDVLHIGHVRSLQAARQLGDRLVIGLNSDASVRALKGDGRPLFPADERAEVLAALTPVDWIVIVEDHTMDRILNLLRPDIYAKGTDYTKETIPERNTVIAYGGQLAIVGDSKTRSSSQFTLQRSAAPPPTSDSPAPESQP